MGPFRTPASPAGPEPAEPERDDDRLVYGVLLVVGAIRVALALADHEAFHAEATFAGLFAAAGLIGLVRTCAKRRTE